MAHPAPTASPRSTNTEADWTAVVRVMEAAGACPEGEGLDAKKRPPIYSAALVQVGAVTKDSYMGGVIWLNQMEGGGARQRLSVMTRVAN